MTPNRSNARTAGRGVDVGSDAASDAPLHPVSGPVASRSRRHLAIMTLTVATVKVQ